MAPTYGYQPDMLLRVEVVERDDYALVTATGEIDASNADSVETAVSAGNLGRDSPGCCWTSRT